MKKKKFSLSERIRSFRFAFSGIKTLIIEEHNARIHLLGATVAIALGIIFQISNSEWLWISLAIVLVFISEMLNSAIEAICDEVTEERKPMIKKAKDIAAGSVLIAAGFALIVALVVFVL
ncbi:MAG: diacylglycerol kinase family protein [Flavobacteriales bacterium]|nr:diacylglycerol kinase family protein [Flavobacteriales bacterium]MCB9196331.1 diacylglycerol kinase family protein [Flavobacteriales bacterium]